MIGSTISHFKITAKLGEGGMGEVYRATDTTLDREVAIKLLPEEVAADAERMARFEREAKVLASLNHSNISSIYGLEGAEGKQFLVLELVEGETVEDRIKRGPVPLEEALELARQMIDGIEAAHERGIVHRDLKPANVKVTPQGQVKVLDFGLAKALDTAPLSSGSEPLLSQSPTLTAQMTGVGVLLGTAAYMSPEQARGDVVDARSDVWSFGVVFFEMLAGKSVYSGGTVSDVLAGILAREPEWEDLPKKIPTSIRRLLERCLDKDIRERYQAIGEVRIALRKFLDDDQVEEEGAGAHTKTASLPNRRAIQAMAAALAISLLVAFGALWKASKPEARPLVKFALAPPEGLDLQMDDRVLLDLSADGQKIVFTAIGDGVEHQLYLRELGSLESEPIAGTVGALNPFFSPDGNWIGFSDNNELKRVASSGGVPLTLAEMGVSRGGTWLPDGTIVYPAGTEGGLLRISADGGEPVTLTELDETRQERTHRWPHALTDGSAVLFTSDTYASTEFYDDARIEAVSVEDGRRVVLLEGTSRARYLPPDRLIYARGGSLFTIPFDSKKLQTTGPPKLVLQEVLTDVSSGAAQFSTATNGTLAYVRGFLLEGTRELVWMDRSGTAESLGLDAGNHQELSLSPDGQLAALSTGGTGNLDMWVVDLARSTLSRLTFEGLNEYPTWTPDGESIAYASSVDGVNPKPYWKPADGSGEAELLWDVERPARPSTFSPDGKFLVLDVDSESGHSDLWLMPLDGDRTPTPFLDSEAQEWMASFSPDGRWLAYASNESGRHEVFIRAFPGPGGRWQVSRNGGYEPRWSADGKILFFRNSIDRSIYEVEIDATSNLKIGTARVAFSGASAAPWASTYSVSKDGKRCLMLRSSTLNDRSQATISVFLNWASNLQNTLAGSG
jgi:serine/threonine-protein kinase